MEALCIVDTYVYITALCTVRRGPHRMDVCGQPWHKWRISEILCCVYIGGYIIVLCIVRRGPNTIDMCGQPWHKWKISEILCCVHIYVCVCVCVCVCVYITVSCLVRRGPKTMHIYICVCGQPWHKYCVDYTYVYIVSLGFLSEWRLHTLSGNLNGLRLEIDLQKMGQVVFCHLCPVCEERHTIKNGLFEGKS